MKIRLYFIDKSFWEQPPEKPKIIEVYNMEELKNVLQKEGYNTNVKIEPIKISICSDRVSGYPIKADNMIIGLADSPTFENNKLCSNPIEHIDNTVPFGMGNGFFEPIKNKINEIIDAINKLTEK